MTSFVSKQMKSTTKGPIGCWRRNLKLAKRRLRSARHNFRSTSVWSRLSRLARSCFMSTPHPRNRSPCPRFLDLSRKGRGGDTHSRAEDQDEEVLAASARRRLCKPYLSPCGRGREGGPNRRHG